MKKLSKIIDQYIQNVEQHWKAIPEKRQRILTKIFFSGYALLTIGIILQNWLKEGSRKNIPLGHISTVLRGLNVKTESAEAKFINLQQKSENE